MTRKMAPREMVPAIEPDAFVAIVTKVLATVLATMDPPLVIRLEDVDTATAELVKRVLAAYPPPPRGLTHLAVTSDGEAVGHVQGDSVDFHRAAKLLRTLTAAAQPSTDVIASRHRRTLTPVYGVQAVAEAAGLDPPQLVAMMDSGHGGPVAGRIVCRQLNRSADEIT